MVLESSLDNCEPLPVISYYRETILARDMALDRDFLRGFVKLYTLWRASKEDVYGVQILKEMAELGFKLSPGTLYPTLAALLKERDVKVYQKVVNGKVRKFYKLTPKGRRELDEVRERLKVLMRQVFS